MTKVKLVILLILISFSFAFNKPALALELVDRSIAIINSEVILQSELKKFQSKIDREGTVDESILPDGVEKKQMKSDSKVAIDYLINERLIDSEVKKYKMEITMDSVEDEIKNLAKRNQVSRAELIASINQQGYSESEYQQFLKTKIQRQNLLDQIIKSKVRISDEDVLAFYYSQNKEKSTQIMEYELSHILFKVNDPNDIESVLEKAKSVYKRLQSGGNFSSLAKEYSEDSDLQPGGFFGIFKTGDFSAEIEKAVSNLSQGEYSKIVRSRLGLHIFKLNKKRIIPSPAYEREKARYYEVVFEKAYKQQLQNWLIQKRSSSFIRINL